MSDVASSYFLSISSGSLPEGGSRGRSWDNTWGYNSPEGGTATSHSFKSKDYCKRECISIHLGQAGLQIGSACWQLYCLEHNLGADGRSLYAMEGSGGESFFQEAVSGKFFPRAVLVDLEPSVLDHLRTGEYRELYHPDQLLSGREDAANNFARGYYTVGQAMLDPVMDWIRRMADDCDSLQGFFLFHSLGGGTGSGFTTLLLEALNREFHKKTKLAFLVYPSPKLSSAVVEPYNAVITTHSCMDFVDCSFMMDNEALYESCVRRLDIARPNFTHLNRIIGQVASSVTASLRFNGALNIDMSEIQTNLVPFPRLHFPVTSYAPLVSLRRANHESVMVRDVTASCFSRSHQLVRCDMTKGKYMACCLLYRGDVSPKDVNTSIARVKRSKNISFVDWSPTGFKVGINCQGPSMAQDANMAQVPRAVCMMSNNSAIAETWRQLGSRFDIMFSKRAFVHWYNRENMCTEEFSEARYDLSALRLDYNEIN